MKRITIILSLITMMLVSSMSFADDVNIFLRNRWDNELEANDTSRDTQVLFIADRIEGKAPESCEADDYVEVDLTKPNCTGEACYEITVNAPANGGKIYLPNGDEVTDSNKTWKANKGQPGLFQVIPDEGFKAVDPEVVITSCGGNSYPGYYMTNHETTKDCSVSFTFTSGTPAQQCDKEPITPQECVDAGGKWESDTCTYEGGVKPINVPADKVACDAADGFWGLGNNGRDENTFYLSTYYATYNWDKVGGAGDLANQVSFVEGCLLPETAPSGGSGTTDTLYFCQPPKFKTCTTTATIDSIDYRSSIAAAMNARPDVKYGLYATTATGAQQVFPLLSRDASALDSVIKNQLKDDFPSIDGTKIPTLSAISDVFDYLQDKDKSPLLTECKYLQLVLLTSGGHSGDDSEHEVDSNLKAAVKAYNNSTYGVDAAPGNYTDFIKLAAEYLYETSSAIKTGCTANVSLSVIGIDPPENSKLFDTTLGQDMATNGGGIYKVIELPDNADGDDRDEFGTNLVNTILDVFDHSRDGATALVTPVAGVSITRGYHDTTLYAPAFEAQEGVNWPGNINIGSIGTIPAASIEDADTDFSFPSSRDIYTLNDTGTAVEVLAKDGDGENVFNQDDVDWLTKLGRDTVPIADDKVGIRELLGDILHFRPLPIHIGDKNSNSTVDNNELFVVVGTNRGLLHVFNKAGVEEWAFLPPQLKPMIKALRQKHIAPDYSMVNHFYGVDGAPSLFIYDRAKDGKIVKTNDSATTDMIMLYFGLRRGGAGYFAFDITDPTAMPTVKWSVGKTTLQYGQSRSGTITSREGSKDATFNQSEKVDPEEQLVGDGGTAGACNEILLTQGTGISGGNIADQCPLTNKLGGGACEGAYTDYCLQGSCDVTSSSGLQSVSGGCGLYGSCHTVLENTSGIYIGTQEDEGNLRIFSSRKLCKPVIDSANTGIVAMDLKPEAKLHYSVAGGSSCYSSFTTNITNTSSKDDCRGHLCVGTAIGAASDDKADTILGFNIAPLADLLVGSNPKIKITKATLSLGHTGYSSIAKYNNYGTGINVYAAKKGAYGDHPWPEASPGTQNKDCLTRGVPDNHLNSGSPVSVLQAPASGTTGLGDRTSGGVISDADVLTEIFSQSGWYTARTEGYDIVDNGDGTYSHPGTKWKDDNVYIQFVLSEISSDTNVYWGRVSESAGVANFMTNDAQYYEKTMPNLHVEWCWTSDPNCGNSATTTLNVNMVGGGKVAVKKGTEAAATCTTSPCVYSDYVDTNVITLTAESSAISTFSSWTDCPSEAGNVCTFTIATGSNSVTANFKSTPYNLSITKVGVDGVEDVTVMADYGGNANYDVAAGTIVEIPAGSNVILTAKEPLGKEVLSWTDWTGFDGATPPDCGAEPICEFDMPGSEVTGKVNYQDSVKYKLTVNVQGEGAVKVGTTEECSATTCIYTTLEEKDYKIEYEPADNYKLDPSTLSGCLEDGCTVSVSATNTNATVSVSFIPVQHTVTASVSGTGGSISSIEPANVDHGSAAVINIALDDNYVAKEVAVTADVGCAGTLSETVDKKATYTTGNLTGNCDVVVTVESSGGAAHLLTVTKSGTGFGTVTSGTVIDCGADCSEELSGDVKLTAEPAASVIATAAQWNIPDYSYVFRGWDGCTATGVTCTVAVSVNKTVTAKFNECVSGTIAKLDAYGAVEGRFVFPAFNNYVVGSGQVLTGASSTLEETSPGYWKISTCIDDQ